VHDRSSNINPRHRKHGTFRPKLLQLVQSNDEDLVTRTTIEAFSLIPALPRSYKMTLSALDNLTKLKGIGPATASLLLSVAAPEMVPFFSDEVFRWCMWDEPGSPGGWKRKIKYNKIEYEGLLEKVVELRERLDIEAVDAEKVAWVLGKEGVDCGDGEEEDGEDAGEVAEEEQEVAVANEANKKSVKRKAADTKTPVEGTRKSARTKE